MKFFQKHDLIEEAVKAKLAEAFGRRVEIYSSATLGGGCISNASKLETSEGTFFLKWNSNCPSDMFVREAESLTELKKAAGMHLVVPEVIVAVEADEAPGFLVVEYLEPGYAGSGQDEALGRGLAFVHQFNNEQFGFYHDNYCGSTLQKNAWEKEWRVFFRENRLRYILYLIQKERPLPPDVIHVYERLLQKTDSLIPEGSVPSLIHGDLWSGNYMNMKKGPALIDPASYYAEREMEMGIMTMFGGFSQRFYKAYEEVYPLDVDWMERNRLYQLYHVLNHYYLFGGGYANQALQIAKSYL